MTQPYFIVDAFTATAFAGNPAAVVPLSAWPDDARLAAIAAEMALSETAFFVPEGDGFRLRWRTPTVEVDLCGHATLATAHVILRVLEPARREVAFATRSGRLVVTRTDDGATLDFPARPARPVHDADLRAAVEAALGVPVTELWQAVNLVAIVDDVDAVRAMSPDLRRVAALPTEGLVATAAGADGVDFVSRYFTPQHGIDEDPVTGSTHCTLTPLWAERLGRPVLTARQLSRRGGALTVELRGDRVRLTGASVLVARGELLV